MLQVMRWMGVRERLQTQAPVPGPRLSGRRELKVDYTFFSFARSGFRIRSQVGRFANDFSHPAFLRAREGMMGAGGEREEQKHTLKSLLIFIQDHDLLRFSRGLLYHQL